MKKKQKTLDQKFIESQEKKSKENMTQVKKIPSLKKKTKKK